MEVVLRKLANGALVPATEEDADMLKSVKVGAGVRCEIVRIRNYRFLQKYMVLVSLLFDIWSETAPRMQYRGQDIAPNKKKFRDDLQILCGHYEAVFGIRGELQLKAKSVSFASMSEEHFENLYSQAINVGLSKILSRPDWTEDKIRQACDEILRFDS